MIQATWDVSACCPKPTVILGPKGMAGFQNYKTKVDATIPFTWASQGDVLTNCATPAVIRIVWFIHLFLGPSHHRFRNGRMR